MNKQSQKRQQAKASVEVAIPRRIREKLEHRRALLKAAEHVFAEKGFERATMEEVARCAEFSVGALYNFFENKDALFGEVVRGLAQDFYVAFKACLQRAKSPLDAIRAVMHLHFEELQRHGPFFRMVVEAKPGSAICPDSAIPRECRAIYDQYVADLSQVFAAAMARRQIRKMDPLYAALALEGVIHAFSAYWHRQGMEPPLDDRINVVSRNFLNVLTVAPKR